MFYKDMVGPISNIYTKAYLSSAPYFKGVEKVGTQNSSDIEEELFNDYISQLKSKNLRSEYMTKDARNYARILEDNKEETKRILGILYSELGKNFQKPDRPHKNLVEWKPTMTEAEAEKFANGSAIKETCYRASGSPELHKKNGYNLDRVDLTYSGIYLAQNDSEARIYGSKPLKVKANVRNVEPYKMFDFKEHAIIERETRSAQLKDVFYNTIGSLENALTKKLNIDAFMEVKEKFGGDTLCTYYVVMDPKNLVIIDE